MGCTSICTVPFYVFRLRPYDLGVPELFVVLVGFTVGFAVGVAVAVLVVPAVAVAVAAFAATFGCSSQWKGLEVSIRINPSRFLASVNDERSCHYNDGTDNQYGEPNCIATR